MAVTPKIVLTHDGKTMSVKEWSKLIGVPVATLRRRIDDGKTVEQVLKPRKIRPSTYLVTYNGKSLTPAEWAEETGIPERAIRHRLWYHDDPTKNWSVEKALTTPTKKVIRYTGVVDTEVEQIVAKSFLKDVADEIELTGNISHICQVCLLYLHECTCGEVVDELEEPSWDGFKEDEEIEEDEWHPDPNKTREQNMKDLMERNEMLSKRYENDEVLVEKPKIKVIRRK